MFRLSTFDGRTIFLVAHPFLKIPERSSGGTMKYVIAFIALL